MGKPDQESAAAEEARRATGDAAGRGRGGRLSARRKRETVLRLLRGEDLESVSRELGITAARAAQWRDQFLAAGQASLPTFRAIGCDGATDADQGASGRTWAGPRTWSKWGSQTSHSTRIMRPTSDDMGREFRIAHGKIMPSLHGISRSQARSSFDWPGMVVASSQPSWYRSSYWASKIVSDFRSGRDSGDYDKEWTVDCISDLIHNESTEELQFENTKRV